MTPLPPDPYAPTGAWRVVETAAAWCLAILWVLPLAYAVWTAFHPPEFSTRFSLARAADAATTSPRAWNAAPFARYFLNTFVLVTMILAAQLVLVHARRLRLRALRVPRPRRRLRARAGAADDHAGRADRRELPHDERARPRRHDPGDRAAVHRARPSASSCCARPSRPCRRSSTTPRASKARAPLQVLLKVYVPLARPIYLAYALVSVSYHWNNFLWPLIVTNSVEARPLTVGLQVFSSGDQGIDWSIITRRDADDLRAAAARLPALPAPVRADRSCAPEFADEAGRSMKLITWNIQWWLGMDGRVDLARVVADARAHRRLRRAVPAGGRRQLPGAARERAARTSSRSSRSSCPATRRSRASRSTFRTGMAGASASAT